MVSAINGNRSSTLSRVGSGELSAPFQATTSFDVRPLFVGHGWFIAGRMIPTGNIAHIRDARSGIDIPTEMPSRFTVFLNNGDFPGLKASKDETTQKRRRYGLENARAGIDYPTEAPARHCPVLVDLNAVDSKGNPLPGQFRLAVSNIQKIEEAQAGVDYPQLSPPAPGVPMPHIERDFAVAVLGPTERVRL